MQTPISRIYREKPDGVESIKSKRACPISEVSLIAEPS